MARTFGRIFGTMWDEDEEFLALGADAKYLYTFLVAQRDLARSGVITLRVVTWARRMSISAERIEVALEELHAEKFVVLDRDETQLLVRSLIRRDEVYKQPNIFKSAAEQIYTVVSRPIRAALAMELERLDEEAMNVEIRRLCAELIAWLRKGSPNPSPNPSGHRSRNGSGNGRDPDSAHSPQDAHRGHGPDEAPAEDHSENPSGNPSENPHARAYTRMPAAFSPYPSPTTAAAAARECDTAASSVPGWAVPLVDRLAAEGFVVSWDLTFLQWDKVRVAIDRSGIPALIEYARRRNANAKSPAYSAGAWVKGWYALPPLDSGAALAPVTPLRPPTEPDIEPSRNAKIIAAARERARLAETARAAAQGGETA